MTILSLGFILLAGLLAGKLIRQLKIPVVTAYLLLGVIIGPSALNLVSTGLLSSSGLISNIVLGLIAFSIGQNFALERFSKIGKPVLWISSLEATSAWLLVTLTFWLLLKQPFYIALLFGAMSSATAPAATMMVIREYKAKGSFTDTLLGVVAIDDAWCLIIFAFSFAIAKAMSIHMTSNAFVFKAMLNSALEIGGAFILGGVLALILSYLSRFITTPSDLLIYTLGFIFLNTGLALYFNFSVLLANMFMAAILVNVHKVSFKFFESLRSIDSPLYLLFFVLAGANLEIGLLKGLGLLGVAYVVFRSMGKIGGAYLGGTIAQVPLRIRKYLGWALLPQAGVALGVALVAKAKFPQIGGMIFTTIVTTTVIYEIIGPLVTKITLRNAGEI
ncbi:MAG: cation:proton antiporter [Candidatus Omnitrophota bacterium]|nr:MAG: cation:proton antiporter [Candidatus Omnitrophota bacterium]